MLYFFSFCCLIEKQTKEQLLFATNLLIKSMDKYLKDYKFIIYSNFNLKINNPKVIIRKYYNHKNNINLYKHEKGWKEGWKNLSMNKIFIYKDLYDEFKENYIWIDLDTYIYHNLSYLEKMDNYFLEYGGTRVIPEKVSTNFEVNFNRYIQGNFWKLNIELYTHLMNVFNNLKKNKITLKYDSQSLFTYYFYKTLKGKINKHKINISGNNSHPNLLNGVALWCPKGNKEHANLNGLLKLYNKNGILKSKFHNKKEIHIVSFTFFTLLKIKDHPYFTKIF